MLKRLLITLALLAAALGLLAWFGPAWFGQWALQRYGGGLSAQKLSGPLWALRGQGVQWRAKGVSLQAKEARLSVSALNPLTKTARVNIWLADGQVDVHFKELFGQRRGGKSRWTVLPGEINVRRMRLNLDGRGANIPSASLGVSGQDGHFTLRGSTAYGPLNGELLYGEQSGTLNVRSDARIVNAYWPAITGGHIDAQYRFGAAQPLSGDLKLEGGSLAVPQAHYIKVTQVSGWAKQRGNLIQGELRGQSLGGPVKVGVRVDTQAKHWQATGRAAPTLRGLGQALGVAGSGGQAALTVSAEGWTAARVSATLSGARGRFAAIPIKQFGGTYSFVGAEKRGLKPRRNALKLWATTSLSGEEQRARLNWPLGGEGQLRWQGTLAGAPMKLSGKLSGKRLSVSGEALGGPASASLNFARRTLRANAQAHLRGVSAQLSASGPLSDLRLSLGRFSAGPLRLSGAGRLNAAGLTANLRQADGGSLSLETGKDWRGRWRASDITLGEARLGGSGNLDLERGLSGVLGARVAGVEALSGPLNLDWKAQRGEWRPGAQRLSWQGRALGVQLSRLNAWGASISGQAQWRGERGGLYGQLSAVKGNAHLRLSASGRQLRLSGALAGAQLEARAQLRAPYRTFATLRGSDVSGELREERGGLAFSLRSGSALASGLIQRNGRIDAAGAVDLGALKPLLGSAGYATDLSGVAQLHLRGLGGSVTLRASSQAAQLRGTLWRRRERWQADLSASLPSGLQTHLSGDLFPQLDLRGPLSWRGNTQLPAQRLTARVFGPYGAPRLSLRGQSAPLRVAGVSLAGQRLSLTGRLGPQPDLSGRWGDLKLSWRGQQLRVSGEQRFVAAGQAGEAQLDATWQPGFAGQLTAQGRVVGYRFSARGPWRRLTLSLMGGGLTAQGSLDAPEQRYAAHLSGRLAGLRVSGQVSGVGQDLRASLRAADGAGGWATLEAPSLRRLRLRAQALRVAGQTLSGDLSSDARGLLSGEAKLLSARGPLAVHFREGQFSLSGQYARHTLRATGRLSLPAQLSGLDIRVSGPALRAHLRGDAGNLRGELLLPAQSWRAAGLSARLAPQRLPLSASLTARQFSVGGLSYAGGQWRGRAALLYALNEQSGVLNLRGEGSLRALPSGPLGGDAQLWPRLGGQLQADLNLLRPALPERACAALTAGKLRVFLAPQGVSFAAVMSRWQGQPLQLRGQLAWRGELRGSALLSQGNSRVPLQMRGQHLWLREAELDAAAPRPLLPATMATLRGRVIGSADLPGFSPQRGSARAALNLSSGEQRARGQLIWAGGQLSAQISSDLGGQPLSVSGPLYPRAAAQLRYGDLYGDLSGDAQQLLAHLSGMYRGQKLTASAQISPQRAAAQAQWGETTAQLSAQRRGDWDVSGQLSIPDLHPFGQRGHLSGALAGHLHDLRARLSGEVAGQQLTLPARFRAGVLSTAGARVISPLSGGEARTEVSGTLWPRLSLSGQSTLNTLLPGRYQLRAGGTLSRPRLEASGALSAPIAGLNVSGTRLRAVISGPDILVRAAGALSGEARGRLDQPGYLQRLDARLNLPYRAPDAALTLRGPLRWSAARGWGGQLNVSGQAYDQPLSAELLGQGGLQVSAQLGRAALRGRLGAGLWQRPSGSLELSYLDAGQFWQRPGQLFVSATARLGGSWRAPQATLRGQLNDAASELSGTIRGDYAAGRWRAQLRGAHTQADAQLDPHTSELHLNTQGVNAARLLPEAWQVGALKVIGTLDTSAKGRAIERLSARNLYLAGEHKALGAFKLRGQALYLPGQAQADLNGEALGGFVRVAGQLPAGLSVSARHLNLSAWGAGQAQADLQLMGDPLNPALSGAATLSHPNAAVKVLLSGRARQPDLSASAQLRGGYGGALYAQIPQLRVGQPPNVRLYGSAARGAQRLSLDMAGQWPKLSGVARITGLNEAVTLDGQGDGRYLLRAGQLGGGLITLSGLNPQLSAKISLNPLPLLGASGQGQLQLALNGPLNRLQLSGGGSLKRVSRSGLNVADGALSLSGSVQRPSAALRQGERVVATLDGSKLRLEGLTLSAAGSRLSVSGDGDLSQPSLRATISASGAISGQTQLNYAAERLSARGSLKGASLSGSFAVSGQQLSGWSGALDLSGGPQLRGIGTLLSRPAHLKLSGSYRQPLLTGDLGLAGAQVGVVASRAGAQLRFSDGPLTKASGVLSLERGRWSGAAKLARRKGQVSAQLSSDAAQPQALFSGKLGDWYALGRLSPVSGQLAYGDGSGAQGKLRWNGAQLQLSGDALDLSRLGLVGVAGHVRASGQLQGGEGTLSAELERVKAGATLPYLGLPLDGSGTLALQLSGGKASLSAKAQLSSGPLSFSARQVGQRWEVTLQAQLSKGEGTLRSDLTFKDERASGSLSAERFPLNIGGLSPVLSGDLSLRGQSFTTSLKARVSGGELNVSGKGGLTNALPALGALTGIAPTEQGYQVQAGLSGLDVSQLGQGLRGQVSGQLLLGEGSGTFALRSSNLQVGESRLDTRIDGTLAGGDWRLRGHLGNSTLFGALTDGDLSARMQLQALPVGGMLTAITGKTVGEGLVTGVARLQAPIADPLSGKADLVAERVRVTAGNETLTGSGTLNFANRELNNLDLHLRGAGSWDVSGQYTRQKVGLSAQFKDTTFTPLLALIPELEHQANVRGTLNFALSGSYERPTATLDGQNLSGDWAGTQFQVPQLGARLASGGDFSARAAVLASGTLGAAGELSASGHFQNQLSGARLAYSGRLSPKSLGDLGQGKLLLSQQSDGWYLDGALQHGGTLQVQGRLTPRTQLNLSADDYNLPIRDLYTRESSVSGNLSAVSEGSAGNIVVSGQLTAARMLLGRDASATKAASPASAQSSFDSPLPPELTALPSETEDAKAGGPSPLLKRVVFNDVRLRAPGNVRLEETMAQAELSADLTLSGTGDQPLLSGEARSLRGTFTLRDSEFNVQSAAAAFDGSSLYPTFTLSARGQVADPQKGQDLGVQLNAEGSFVPREGKRALQLQTDLSCVTCSAENNYSEAELYSLLALGTPDISKLADANTLTNLGTSAASTAINVFVLGEVQRSVARALGLDVFRISSNLLNPDGSVDARFTVGTYLSRQLYVQYQVDLTGAGLLDASYTTDDGRLSFKVSTPLTGFDLSSVRPSFTASYNIGARHSLSLGVQSGLSTKLLAGYVYKW